MSRKAESQKRIVLQLLDPRCRFTLSAAEAIISIPRDSWSLDINLARRPPHFDDPSSPFTVTTSSHRSRDDSPHHSAVLSMSSHEMVSSPETLKRAPLLARDHTRDLLEDAEASAKIRL